MIEILTPARIHITLIDLGSAGYRRNGGAGFFVNNPSSRFVFKRDTGLDLDALSENGFSFQQIHQLAKRLLQIKEKYRCGGVKIVEARTPPRHSGFGCGTSTTLACIEGFARTNEIELTEQEIVHRSGRGGTSGVGIHGYFTGGFIFDLGRPYDADPIKSSDDIDQASRVPLLMSNLKMPPWEIGIFIPPDVAPVSQEYERRLFSETLPLTPDQVQEIAYHSVFGLVPSILESDFDSFCRAVSAIQGSAWKRSEIKLHCGAVEHYLEDLLSLGCTTVGMSSVGPALYFLTRDMLQTVDRIKSRHPTAKIDVASPDNTGRVIRNA